MITKVVIVLFLFLIVGRIVFIKNKKSGWLIQLVAVSFAIVLLVFIF